MRATEFKHLRLTVHEVSVRAMVKEGAQNLERPLLSDSVLPGREVA